MTRVLFSYYLLFETEEQYLHYRDLSEDHELFDRLNMDIVEDKLRGCSETFPTQFIRKMNPDPAVAEFRGEVFCELARDSLWRTAEELCELIASLRVRSNAVVNVADPVHRKIVDIHTAPRYFSLLDRLSDFVSQFRSVGLRRAADMLRTYLAMPEIASDKAEILNAEALLNSHLRVSLKIDRAGKSIIVSDDVSDGAESLRELDGLCRELTGVAVCQPFAVVDASSPTMLEKLILDRLLKENGDVAHAVENAPTVGIRWESLALFREQISFYVAFIRLFGRLKEKGLPSCRPAFDGGCRIRARGMYDLSLSVANIDNDDFGQTVNGIDMGADTDGFILTGANQGGKTTFLRSVGTAVYLAMCGCPVPAESMTLCPYGEIIALFGGEEDEDGEVSRFEGEIKKYYRCRGRLDRSALVLLNEYFTGTNRFDAVEILGQCIAELTERQATYGCVTHFQEIYEFLGDDLNGRILYLRAEVPPDNDPRKRYTIERGYPDGRAYSERITRSFGMTYDELIRQFEERGVEGV